MVSYFIGVDIIIEHFMATWRCKISLLMLKNISLVSLCTPIKNSNRNFVSPWSWNNYILLFECATKKFRNGRGGDLVRMTKQQKQKQTATNKQQEMTKKNEMLSTFLAFLLCLKQITYNHRSKEKLLSMNSYEFLCVHCQCIPEDNNSTIWLTHVK